MPLKGSCVTNGSWSFSSGIFLGAALSSDFSKEPIQKKLQGHVLRMLSTQRARSSQGVPRNMELIERNINICKYTCKNADRDHHIYDTTGGGCCSPTDQAE